GGERPRPHPPARREGTLAGGQRDPQRHGLSRGPDVSYKRRGEPFVVGADDSFQLAGLQVVAAEQFAGVVPAQPGFGAAQPQVAEGEVADLPAVADLQFEFPGRLAVAVELLHRLAVEHVEDAVVVHVEGRGVAVHAHRRLVDASLVNPAVLAVEADADDPGGGAVLTQEVKGLRFLADTKVAVAALLLLLRQAVRERIHLDLLAGGADPTESPPLAASPPQ